MTRKVRTYTLRLPRSATIAGQRDASLALVLKPGKGWNVADLMAEWHRVQEAKAPKPEQAERAPSQKTRRVRRAR
jgi:hypothetical protein